MPVSRLITSFNIMHMRRHLSFFSLLLFALTATAQDFDFDFNDHYSLTWQKFNAAYVPLEQIGTLVTHHADGSGLSRWSVGCECLDRDMSCFANYRKDIGELGVGYARIQSGWAKCEKVKGEYDFAWLDEIVNGLNEEGVLPWMCLCYGNPVYGGAGADLGSRLFSDEETMKGWCNYVKAVVRRYADKVYAWEVWNEPNLGPNQDVHEEYAALFINTAEIVRKYDKDAKIYGISIAEMNRRLTFVENVLGILKEKGKLHLMDYVSFHAYYHNPDYATADILALEELIHSFSEEIGLYQGETGCPSILEWGHAMPYHEWTEYSQAKFDARRMINDFALDINSSIFTIVDHQYKNMLQSFGLLRANLLKEIVYRRPAYYAVSHIANLLKHDMKPVEVKVESACGREIGSTGIADKDGRTIGVALWFKDNIPDDSLERELVCLNINDFSVKDPVYVDAITGKVYKIPVHSGSRTGGRLKCMDLPLYDSPIFIMERSAVEYIRL